jgi:chromosome segregation ATPase
MLEAFEVSRACFNISFGSYPPFLLGFDFGFDRGQELKERSRRKSLFIHHESNVWAVLTRQWALVEEANKRLSKKSAEANELRVVHAVVREEAAQAWEAAAKAHEDTTKAQEEAAKAREDHMPLLARVKELEKDVALVSGERDALNVQIGLVSARVGTLESEVMTLTKIVRSRDEALSGTNREIEVLRATIHDRDEVLRAAEKVHNELRDQIVGWQTHAEGRFPPDSNLDLGFLCVG